MGWIMKSWTTAYSLGNKQAKQILTIPTISCFIDQNCWVLKFNLNYSRSTQATIKFDLKTVETTSL